MMRSLIVIAVLALASSIAGAQNGSGNSGGGGSSGGGPSGGNQGLTQIAFRIPDETSPPGGVAQMKLLITEPTPISSGRPHTSYDEAVFDDVWGVEMFGSAGDSSGVAVKDGNAIWVSFISSGSGTGNDYPYMTLALHVRPDAAPGSKTQFTLDSESAWTVRGIAATMKPIVPANITVGGSLSITNVVPGGGLLPAGSVVKVQGLGFQPHTQVQISSFTASSIVVVSPTEIDLVLAQATNMTGKKIQVVNPDGSQDTYYSYLRGITLGASAYPLLTSSVPIFSSLTFSKATFTQIAPLQSSQFSGLALQNSGLMPSEVTLTLSSTLGFPMGTATFTLPPGYRLMRGIGELIGASPTAGSYLQLSSSQPVQMFGFLADQSAKSVTPFVAASTTP